MERILTAEAVEKIMKDVLFKSDEIVDGKPPADAVIVSGLLSKFGFHRARLEGHAPSIKAMLGELPEQFDLKTGGGWSFLNGCMDRHGSQWGEQRDVDHLVCLGIGIGAASWLMREMAAVMPGGVPYFEVHPESAATAA